MEDMAAPRRRRRRPWSPHLALVSARPSAAAAAAMGAAGAGAGADAPLFSGAGRAAAMGAGGGGPFYPGAAGGAAMGGSPLAGMNVVAMGAGAAGPFFPGAGKFYAADAGYPNRLGYLAPYKGQRYHIPEWRRGVAPQGEQETFNHLHSSIRNSVERAFGMWKNKWRVLFAMPSYPLEKQMMIIAATMCLHNFIRENDSQDKHFMKCDRNPDYVPTIPSRYSKNLPSRNASDTSTPHSSDRDMDKFRDDLAKAIYLSRS